MKLIVSLLVIGALSGCGKSKGDTDVKSLKKKVCTTLMKLKMVESEESCSKTDQEMKKVLGSNYEAGLRCIVNATTKNAVKACAIEHADKAAMAASMTTYANKSKAAEATFNMRHIYQGVAMYYTDESSRGEGSPRSLPASAGPTPKLGSCCASGDTCVPDPALWAVPEWQAFGFSVRDPSRFSYEYKRSDDGKSFTISAYGDLDCDKTFSTYRSEIAVDADGDIGIYKELDPIQPLE